MSLFNYSKKVKVILLAILLLLVFSTITLLVFDRSRVKDLELVEQVKVFATALEKYYDKFQIYPESKEINLETISFLTENGLNQKGEVTYYQKVENFKRPVSFLSSGNHYTLKFNLKNKWGLWGLDSWRGGECRMLSNLALSCQS
ncbi:hypothetical protein H6761_02435 [Candidatus Nomurabacteria bacterium]|nr:hypothetical protein [Candidatus Nomurabacteria bacterium]